MPNHHKHRWLDRMGAAGSLTCAIHCSVLPILIAVLPGFGVGLLANRTVEVIFVIAATLLASLSMWMSWKRHKHIRAKGLLVPGVLVLWVGILTPAIHDNAVAHAVVMTLGGVLVGLGHLLTLRQNHSHIHDATCAH